MKTGKVSQDEEKWQGVNKRERSQRKTSPQVIEKKEAGETTVKRQFMHIPPSQGKQPPTQVADQPAEPGKSQFKLRKSGLLVNPDGQKAPQENHLASTQSALTPSAPNTPPIPQQIWPVQAGGTPQQNQSNSGYPGYPGQAGNRGMPITPPLGFSAGPSTPFNHPSQAGFPASSPLPFNYPAQPGFSAGPGGAQANYPGTMSPPSFPGNPLYQNNPAPRSGSLAMMQPPPGNNNTPFKKGQPRRRFPTWARVAVSFLAVLILLSGGAFAYYQAEIAPSLNSITGHVAKHRTNITTGTPGAQVANTGATLSGNRINILLLGSDTDGKNGAPLAQTDIVVTIDPNTGYVGMLSIPRDMQVTVPDYWSMKMDGAFSSGYDKSSDPVADAAGLAMDTVEYNYGIHIDHYAWVGLTGFVKVIDTANGVDVDVTHPMDDDTYPDDVNNPNGNVHDYTRLYIAPGPQHLTGPQALEYVRTRHSDLVGDFGRSARQQQVLGQLKARLATPDTLTKVPTLLNDLKGSVETDMQIDTIIQLANYARGVDTNKIERITLSPPYSKTGILAGGNLQPQCASIEAAISKMFALATPKCIPQNGPLASADTSTTTNISTAIASATTTSTPSNTTASVLPTTASVSANLGNNFWQGLEQMNPFANIQAGAASPTAVHSLLDLMFAVVFENFDGWQV